MPKNLSSGKEYRGINVFPLHCLGYESPYFMTYKQAKTLGGHIQKGSKGCPVVFWRLWERVDEDGTTQRIPIPRYYTVFNVAQTEGIEAPPPWR